MAVTEPPDVFGVPLAFGVELATAFPVLGVSVGAGVAVLVGVSLAADGVAVGYDTTPGTATESPDFATVTVAASGFDIVALCFLAA